MAEVVVIDAGPLVALIDPTERMHQKMVQVVRALPAPFITAEPVLTEACFLLQRVHGGAHNVLELVRERLILVGLEINDEAAKLGPLMTRYANVPMSLADACLVRLTELHANARLLTFDSDFRVYRRNRNRHIECVELE